MKDEFLYIKMEFEKYIKNVKNLDIRIYGGLLMNLENFMFSKWIIIIGNDLVVVDRNGFLFDYVIFMIIFFELFESLVEEVV